MRRIAICNPCIEEGDAISNDMLGMAKALLDQGHEVSLFVKDCKLDDPIVKPISDIMTFIKNPRDVFIYHYGAGWDYGLWLLRVLKCKKVVKYHNVTPPEFFARISPDYENVCRAGRGQLKDLAVIGADLYLADSEYSKHELIEFGVEEHRCFAVPPFHHIDQLELIDADLNIIDQYNDELINILMVGRLVPNKGHDLLIESFVVYNKQYNPDSRLLLVGWEDPRLRSYIDFLKKTVEAEELEEHVVFSGKVSIAALKSYYLVANVFMIASRHEGFCVPLVEAMSMKIPIVAYASTAIRGTVAKAGLIWEEYDPYLLAASVDRIARDEKLQVGLGEMGWQRYRSKFSNSMIEADFLKVMGELI